jgi:tellurite resistance protein TehA-like permease
VGSAPEDYCVLLSLWSFVDGCLFTQLHGGTTPHTVIFIIIAARTANLTIPLLFHILKVQDNISDQIASFFVVSLGPLMAIAGMVSQIML